MMNDTTDAKERVRKLAAFRSPHTIVAVDESHELFGTIHRCKSCGIRVHWITRRFIHDGDEITDLLQEEYGGSFGQPKERAIERIAALVDESDGMCACECPDCEGEPHPVHEQDDRPSNREGMPEFNGAFR